MSPAHCRATPSERLATKLTPLQCEGPLFVTRSPVALLLVANGPADRPVSMSAPFNTKQAGIRCRTPPAESFLSSGGGNGLGPIAGRERDTRDNEDKRHAESRRP